MPSQESPNDPKSMTDNGESSLNDKNVENFLNSLPDESSPSDDDELKKAVDELEKKIMNPPPQTRGDHQHVLPKSAAPVGISDPALAETIGQLQREVAELRSRPAATPELKGGPAGYPWQYYRRADRGLQARWVTVGPGGANPQGRRDTGAFVKYMTKGMTPLTGYEVVDAPSAYSQYGGQFVPLLRSGGAKEFPITQILAYKWHVRPPIAGLTFPEYEKNKDRVRHFACEDCPLELYMLDDDRDTGMECFRHLRKDTDDGRHAYSRREATAILMEQGIPFSAGRYAALAEELKRAEIGGDASALRKSAKVLAET